MKMEKAEKFILTFLAIVFVIVVGLNLKSNMNANTMIENAKMAEKGAKEYFADYGVWPVTNEDVEVPKGLLDEKSKVANLDEEKLLEFGYIESLKGEYVDFGVIVLGPDTSKVFFIGNEGEGVSRIIGNKVYGDDLTLKDSASFKPIIPVPVFALK